MANIAPQVHCKSVSEVRAISLDVTGLLDDGELATGSPSVTAGGLTIGAASVNSSAITINNISVAIGKAILFTVSGGTAGADYEIDIEFLTDSSQTIRCTINLTVVAD